MAVKQESHTRIWRVTLDSSAGIMLSPRSITLAGDKNNFISLSETGVNVVSGKFNIITDPGNISKGILFTEQIGFLQILPSSCVMPIPSTMPNMPGMGMLAAIGKSIPIVSIA